MTSKFFHSDHLVWLVNHDQAHDFLEGRYFFRQLNSGLSIHGGTLCPSQSLKSGRIINRYVNLIVLLEGSLRFAINEQRYDITAASHGKLILITPDNSSLFTRYLVSGEQSTKIAIKGIERWIDDDDQHHYPGLYQQAVRIRELDAQQRHLSLNFLQQTMSPSPSSLVLDYSALKLLDQLWENFASDCTQHETIARIKPQHEFIRQLTNAYQPRLSAQELANYLHLSERTLQRRIKSHFNCSLREWMHQQKMILALKLLVQNQLSISEVSYECGYQHVSNFGQAFKQFFDSTPAEIQRANTSKSATN